MAERTSNLKRPADIEEQLWPTVCATLVLVGILSVVVWQNSDFDEDRLLLNGYTHLAALGLGAAMVIFIASRLRGTARRTAELAIVFSLAYHAAAGVGAYYLFSSPLSGFSLPEAARDSQSEADDDPPPPDYHWGQDDEQQPEQAFEKAIVSKIREQDRPAAELKPRTMERPAPAVDTRDVAKAEITPADIRAGAEPSKPLEIRRPKAAEIKEVPPADDQSNALAMLRQKSDPLPLPKVEQPLPLGMPHAPPESPRSPGPVEVKVGKLDRADWATVAEKTAARNEPPPRKMARAELQPSEALPSPEIVALVPARAAPRTHDEVAGAEAADRITEEGSSHARSSDALPAPSAIVPDAAQLRINKESATQSPPAAGGSPSRLEAVSTVPVEKSDLSRAPLGLKIASNGAQDDGSGSRLLASRQGAADAFGRALPSIAGNVIQEPGELRSGAPSSDLVNGLPLPAAAARRAIASQTEDGGQGPSPSLAANLPRTRSEMGFERPAAAKIAESTLSRAGGTAPSTGGRPSSLDVGAQVSMRRFAGAGTDNNANWHSVARGVGGTDNIAEWHSAAGNAIAGPLGPSGPRRVDNGAPDGDDNGLDSIPRGRAKIDGLAPHATPIPVGPAGSVAGADDAQVTPSGTIGPLATIGPNSLGGIRQRKNIGPSLSGRGAGSRPVGQADSEITAQVGVSAPQTGSGAGRGGRGDAQLDQILAGDESGLNGIGRGNGQFAVSGQVHEPMTPFRRGAVRGGLTLGDSAGGQLTEPAIENGLVYFSHSQFNDGHWSLHESPGSTADPATMGSLHADTAATGLALLTYLGAGYTHHDEKYRDVVRRGVEWLLKHQKDDGDLAYHGSDPSYDPNTDPTNFYSHGIAAMALCEAYGMTRDRELRGPAQKAIDFIVKSQDPSRGGWRYKSQDGADTSVTGWQLMALRSAQMAELEVPDETLRKVGHWLDLAQVPGRGTYVYNPWNADTEKERLGRAPNSTMTAQAMVMRLYLGQDRDHETLAQGADYVLAHLPEVGTAEASQRDCYYWYYATQAMYHMQGDYWKTWYARVTPLLRAGQVERGPLKGSWNPSEPVPDRWSKHGGRHYVTAIHVLTLEFPYWHLPLFRELRKE
jgi:hypothetical protein